MGSVMLISQMPDMCHVLECHQHSLIDFKYFTLSIKKVLLNEYLSQSVLCPL